ncbi:hypothetical protein LSH36_506g00005 [Paralvinella palmiformis]|uniref:DDE Tnp4 domain-containing protein n=1 Tax=Paralvinella palmiformis TaxID=53620 RepID=A0AAD9J874_9ANNE|nr:hypothetical protein LSH36_506g00005 [Paralvinella palmiformis]
MVFLQAPQYSKVFDGGNTTGCNFVHFTRKIANCRIHVERVIGCVRQKYTILGGTLPIDYLLIKDQANITIIDQMCHVCCALINCCEPIVSFD